MKIPFSRMLVRIAQICAVLCIVYLLSPGPLTLVLSRINKTREWDDAWLQNLYFPINWANQHSPTFQKCMASYLDLWDSPKRDGD